LPSVICFVGVCYYHLIIIYCQFRPMFWKIHKPSALPISNNLTGQRPQKGGVKFFSLCGKFTASRLGCRSVWWEEPCVWEPWESFSVGTCLILDEYIKPYLVCISFNWSHNLHRSQKNVLSFYLPVMPAEESAIRYDM